MVATVWWCRDCLVSWVSDRLIPCWCCGTIRDQKPTSGVATRYYQQPRSDQEAA